MEPSTTPAEEREPIEPQPVETPPVETQPEETQPVTPDVPAEPEPAEPARTLPAVEPVEPEAVAAPSQVGPVDAEVGSATLPEQLALEEVAPAAPDAPDLGAVERPTAVQPAQATNLDLPSLELPHPAPEPARPVPPPVPLAGGQDYTQNLAQSAYGQPTPQPAPAPQAAPPYAAAPYAAAPYATPPVGGQQYGQPPYNQAPYGTQPGYGQQGYGQMVPSDQLGLTDANTWATAAHWSSLLLGLVSLPFLGPLLVMLIQGPKSARVRANAVESLNFDLTMIIAFLVSLLLTIVVIGALLIPIVGLVWFVLKIVATVQTSNGQDYRYPFNIRMVK